MNCFPWIKLISVLIHLKQWYYNTPSLKLPCLPFHLCHFPLVNWNPSLTQFSLCSPSVSLFLPNPFDRTPKLLGIPNHMPSQTNQIYYQVIFKSWYLIGILSFKVRQFGQQQLYFQYKVSKILYKMVGTLSFSQPSCAYNPPPPTIISIKNPFPHFSNFSPPYFCLESSLQSTSKVFSLPQPLSQIRLRQRTNEQ